jgi:hypothetical protein
MNVKPSATDFIRGGNYSSGTGVFTYWNGSMKKAISDSKDGVDGSPFESVRTNNLRYQDSGTYGDDRRVKLIDSDYLATSSWLTFTLKPGWQGLFYIKTANNDFFEDYVSGDYVSDKWNNSDSFTEEIREATDLLSEAGYPSIWVQDNAEITDSRAIVALDGDNADYISFDIDSESSNVGQARIRIDGDQYLSNQEIDKDVWITLVWLRKWNPDATIAEPQGNDNEYAGPLLPDGSGDLDGDGVPDGEDFDPYDPDVQNEGDTDYDDQGNVIGEVCPPGTKDNGSGICVPIEDDEEDDVDDEDDDDVDLEVSTGAIVLVLAAIIGTVFLAVKL